MSVYVQEWLLQPIAAVKSKPLVAGALKHKPELNR
jgi:hypothetical protein